MHRWLGPYQVTPRIGANTYRLQEMDTTSQTVAHILRIKKIPKSSVPILPPTIGSEAAQSTISHNSANHAVATEFKSLIFILGDSEGESQKPNSFEVSRLFGLSSVKCLKPWLVWSQVEPMHIKKVQWIVRIACKMLITLFPILQHSCHKSKFGVCFF